MFYRQLRRRGFTRGKGGGMATEQADIDELFPDEGRRAIDAYQAWRIEFFLPGQENGDSPSAVTVPEQRRGTRAEGEDSVHHVPRHLHDQICPDPLTDGPSGPEAADVLPAPRSGESCD